MLKRIWADSERRNLSIILIILVLIALALGSLVIWAAFRKPYVDPITLSPHAWEGMTDEDKLRVEVWDKADDVSRAMTKLAEQDPIDIDAINNIYNEAIALAVKNGQNDYVRMFLIDRDTFLTSKGLTQESLDILLNSDLENILSWETGDLSLLYGFIIANAYQLGYDDIVEEYENRVKDITERRKKMSVENNELEGVNSE